MAEQQKVYAQESQISGGEDLTSAPAVPESSTSGSNRAGLYADVAMEASGVGTVSQMGKMALDIVKDRYDPAQGMGINTFEDIISGVIRVIRQLF